MSDSNDDQEKRRSAATGELDRVVERLVETESQLEAVIAGDVSGVDGIIADDCIGSKHPDHKALSVGFHRYRNVFDSLAEGVLVADDDGLVIEANASALYLLSIDNASLVGASLDAILSGRTEPLEGELDEDGAAFVGVDGSDGTRRWLSVSSRTIDGRPCEDGTRRIVSLTDVTALCDAHRVLRDVRSKLEGQIRAQTAELTRTVEILKVEIEERRRVERALEDLLERYRSSLHQKDLLLQEVHHRVKNNLQVVASMLDLQARAIADEEVRRRLTDSRHRVHTMAFVHEKLYRSPDLARIAFKDYLSELTTYLHSASRCAAQVCIETMCDDVYLTMDEAITLGLVVNESVSNALEHAFVDRECGTIRVDLTNVGAERFRLSISDDGIGLPPTMNESNHDSLGLQLIHALGQQMGARVELLREGGTSVVLHFSSSAINTCDTTDSDNGLDGPDS